MQKFNFKLLHQDKKTRARVGEIRTPHGLIKTPAFVPVGTQATVKSLTPEELESLGVELFFVNTYYAYLRPGDDVIEKFGGLHKFMNWKKPLITDSGGFQVFSLGRKRFGLRTKADTEILNQVQDDKVSVQDDNTLGSTKIGQPLRLVKIDEDGVTFTSHWDGSTHRFTPEKSIDIQHQLGADIILAFDDCTPYPATHKQATASMERTHRWAERSLDIHKKLWKNRHSGNPSFDGASRIPASLAGRRTKYGSWASQDDGGSYQALFGVVQGSIYEDLRKESADFVSSLDFDGIAIGGVAVGESKEEMRQVLDWVIPRLQVDKPRHLLGVGEINDIFDIIERGVDTFDCVQPTRLGRMGHLFINHKSQITMSKNFTFEITKKIYAKDTQPVSENCGCYTCQNFSRAYIHHLFRVRELLAYRLATIHNIHFVTSLVTVIRQHIKNGTFLHFKREFLKIYE